MLEHSEGIYLHHLGKEGPLDEQIRQRSKEAEAAVMRFFDENFEGMRGPICN